MSRSWEFRGRRDWATWSLLPALHLLVPTAKRSVREIPQLRPVDVSRSRRLRSKSLVPASRMSSEHVSSSTRIEDWRAVAEVHGEYFRDIRPVNTIMQVAQFVDPEWLIETEVDAVVSEV